MPKHQDEQWIDEPFETPHYPSEADMHNCACWVWNGELGEDLLYTIDGPIEVPFVHGTVQVQAPDLNAERLSLVEWDVDSEVYIDIQEATYNSGVPTQPSTGIRLYCDGGELWIIRSDGSTTELS